MVVLLGNGVLCGKPYILLSVQTVGEAGTGKSGNGLVNVVQTLDNAVGLEIVDQLAGFLALSIGHNQLRLTAALHLHLGVLVHIPISVTGNGNGLCPGRNVGGNALDQDGGSEHGTIQDGTDGAVGGLPHFLQVVFGHSCCVGCNGSALYSHTVFLGGFCAVQGHLVTGFIPVNQSQVVVIHIQIHIGRDENILDPLPQDPGHFVPVHFDQGRFHLNFAHRGIPPCMKCCIALVKGKNQNQSNNHCCNYADYSGSTRLHIKLLGAEGLYAVHDRCDNHDQDQILGRANAVVPSHNRQSGEKIHDSIPLSVIK